MTIKNVKSSTVVIYQGSAVVRADKFGNVSKVNPDKNEPVSIPAVSGKYTQRFNDPTYYG